MKVIVKIARAELRNLFYSPVAWFLVVAFMVQCAFFYDTVLYGKAKLVELLIQTPYLKLFGSMTKAIFLDDEGIFRCGIVNLYLYIPLLTMGLLSREVSSGSIKLLYSSPVKTKQIVFGKYLAMMIFSFVLLLVMGFFMVSSLFQIKAVDYGLLITASVGFYLIMCAYAAVGLFMSSLTTYQIISCIATFIILFILARIGTLWQDIDFVRDLTWFLSMSGRADKLLLGLVTTRDVIYFLVVIAMFISFTLLKLRSGRESKPWYINAGRYLAVMVLALTVGYISSRPKLIGYWDATAQKTNTVHPRIQNLIKQLGDAPLEVTLYTNLMGMNGELGMPQNRNNYLNYFWERYYRFKPDIIFKYEYYYDLKPDDPLFKTYAGKNLHQIAQEYAKAGDYKLSKFKTPEEMRKTIDLEPENYGLVMQLRYKGRTTFLRTYPDSKKLPGDQHVAAAIARLLQPRMPLILFAKGNLERDIRVLGERGYSGLTTEKTSRFSLINNGFDIDSISLERQDIPSDSSGLVLVLADPKTALSPVAKRRIQEYTDRGGNMLLLGEPKKAAILNPVLQPMGVQMVEGTLVKASINNTPDMIFPILTKQAAGLAESDMLLYLKSGDLDTLEYKSLGTAPLAYREGGSFTGKPLVVTRPGTWLKRGTLVTDSVPPVLNAAEGDSIASSFTAVMGLTRQVNGKEQRIAVAGDADFLSNRYWGGTIDFGTGLFSWLDNNQYPYYGPVPLAPDYLLTISSKSVAIWKVITVWIIPALLAIAGAILIIRRKRK